MVFARGLIYCSLLLRNWCHVVVRFFGFVSERSSLRTASIIPDWRGFGLLLVCVFAVIALFYAFADPAYIRWNQAGGVDRDGIFGRTTDIGKSNWFLYLTGTMLLAMSLHNFNHLDRSQKVHWNDLFWKLYFAFTSVAFSGLLAILFKNIFGRARPQFYDGPEIWFASPWTDTYLFASFPSGHSTTVGTFAAILFLFSRRIGYLFIPFALWLGASRMVVGAHFPSDVAAGLSLGVVFTWLYARSFAKKRILFQFNPQGGLELRSRTVEKARQKIRRQSKSLLDPGLALKKDALDGKL